MDDELTTGELLILLGTLKLSIDNLETVMPSDELRELHKLANKVIKIIANKMREKANVKQNTQ